MFCAKLLSIIGSTCAGWVLWEVDLEREISVHNVCAGVPLGSTPVEGKG